MESTKEILRIACSWAPKFLHYVSTIGVFAPLSPSEHIDEHSTPSHDRFVNQSSIQFHVKRISSSVLGNSMRLKYFWGEKRNGSGVAVSLI